jgi:ubiquinone/menaquinone biosynthesis C-methylase UbiE
MTQSSKFWDKTSARYSKSPIADEGAYQKKLDVTRKYFRPDMNVLEFGCGTGSTALVHAPYVKHYHAIDFSSKMIEIARGKADAENIENVTFEVAAIDDFSAPGENFDGVLGLSVLHLLEDKDQAIAKVHKLLKPGGVFISSTVCFVRAMKLFSLIVPIARLFGVAPLVKFFTVQEIEQSLIDGGFEIDYRWRPSEGKSSLEALFIVAKKAT